ncbi:tripartite tricarboxylate transporter substrate binding protein [Xylophilus sp. GOD-11R]|uniref:Bug family tripartite tricarboxylate transporter substrate binding protein n=1 Tax=Xylophilus sp. GOD-11R TaxID=3089814 RepID=UPI00298C0D6F|nr:tripartite tricarboxylate transporter substrate binding protein [Xylophilus sp. GOD-11R]WPB57350.1 tripartite tricarboxylate transporter substrate binding protein [Xylophilus sp. GOD-11R]
MKPINKRRAIALGALALGAFSVGLPTLAQAQGYPTKPVTLVVPFPPGGSSDVLARALTDKLSQSLGQPVVVESRPGAGATLGAAYVATAKADGYVLLMGAVHHAIATSVYKKLPYDFDKSFAPVTTVALVPNVLVVSAKSPVTDVKGLVAQAKAAGEKEKLSFGSNGNGTLQHLIGTQFASATGIELLHVPYKGSAPLTTDLLGGQVAMSFDTITPVVPFIKGGKLRALAVTTGKRSSTLPEVPTLEEAGLKGFDLGTWFGILAPAGTPKDVVAKLNAEMVKIIHSPDFKKRMEDIGAEPIGDTPEQMAAQIKADTARYARLVKDANVVID